MFQTEEQKRARELEKDEEAVTDIEDARSEHDSGSPSSAAAAPCSKGEQMQQDDESTEAMQPPRKKLSPFDSWRRLKTVSTATSSKPARGRKRANSEEQTDLAHMV